MPAKNQHLRKQRGREKGRKTNWETMSSTFNWNVNFSDFSAPTTTYSILHHASSTDSRAAPLLRLRLDHNTKSDYVPVANEAIQRMSSSSELSRYFASPIPSTTAQADPSDGQPTLLSFDAASHITKKNKLYICTFCSFTCAWLFDLKQHLRKKHCLRFEESEPRKRKCHVK